MAYYLYHYLYRRNFFRRFVFSLFILCLFSAPAFVLAEPRARSGAQGASAYSGSAARVSSARRNLGFRCQNGDDPHCQNLMEHELARQMRNMEYQERATLGRDYCLFFQNDPRCQAGDKREEQRSRAEIQSYCGKNPDAPRCIGMHLDPGARTQDDFGYEPPAKPKDDFFSAPNEATPRRALPPAEDEMFDF